ncbi:hypothetical protein Agub_g6982, partial [Astrephomene gubernaculifera]
EDVEVCSNPHLIRLGAATCMWLQLTGAAAGRQAGRQAAPARACEMPAAAAAAVPNHGSRGGNSRSGSTGSLVALQAVLEASQALTHQAGLQDSPLLLHRALQLLAAGCACACGVQRGRQIQPPPLLAAATATASTQQRSSEQQQQAACDPWVTLAERLSCTQAQTGSGASTTGRGAATAVAGTATEAGQNRNDEAVAAAEISLTARELYDMLAEFSPGVSYLDEQQKQLQPLAERLATVAAVTLAHSPPGAAGEEVR